MNLCETAPWPFAKSDVRSQLRIELKNFLGAVWNMNQSYKRYYFWKKSKFV